jgi:hypothetical protein
MKAFLITFLFVLLYLNAYSDDGRSRFSFKSGNGEYELRVINAKQQKSLSTPLSGSILQDSLSWGLFENSSEAPLYVLKGNNISSKTVFVSNDGKSVAIIDDYSVAEPSDTLRVIDFYKSGSLFKVYRLGDLLCSSYNISESVSHFTWLPKLDFFPSSNTLVLETFELNTIRFDIVSGRIINKIRNPILTKTSFLGFGRIHKLSRDKYEFIVSQRVYGKVPDNGKIVFRTKRKSFSEYETIILDQGEEIKSNTDVSSWVLNQNSYPKEKEILQKIEGENKYLNRKLGTCL